MEVLRQSLAVGCAGFFGALARFGVTAGAKQVFPDQIPAATLFVNLTGCLVLGWFLAMASQRSDISPEIRIAVAVGFIGTYTTFSTYIAESNSMIETHSYVAACMYVLGSIVLGWIAFRLGGAVAGRTA